MTTKVPQTLKRCKICGELKGTAQGKEVLCLCSGPTCVKCNNNRLHRPVSNYWDEKEGRVIHVPWYVGFDPRCGVCKNAYIEDYSI